MTYMYLYMVTCTVLRLHALNALFKHLVSGEISAVDVLKLVKCMDDRVTSENCTVAASTGGVVQCCTSRGVVTARRQ